jgi:hypothetical protein
MEDSPHVDAEVAAMLATADIPFIYSSYGPTTCVDRISVELQLDAAH